MGEGIPEISWHSFRMEGICSKWETMQLQKERDSVLLSTRMQDPFFKGIVGVVNSASAECINCVALPFNS